MTSTDFSQTPSAAKRTSSTMSFGTHRQSDCPASAIRAGASTRPAAWHADTATAQTRYQHGAPVRRIGDIIADPFRAMIATKARKIALTSVAVITGLVLIF